MATLEELIKRASKASRKPARSKATPLWPQPNDPDVSPDLITTMSFGEARTCEERCQTVHDARAKAIWDLLRLPAVDRPAGPLPWCTVMPRLWDPHRLLDGEHDPDGWASVHPLMDYYPAPAGGLQHHVSFRNGRFVAHGVAASLLPAPPSFGGA